jgi:hypothetical protein
MAAWFMVAAIFPRNKKTPSLWEGVLLFPSLSEGNE